MPLAATLTSGAAPGRGAIRRAIRLAGTMRGRDDYACDIAILDISATGFLAELPDGVELDPGARVRVATVALGRHPAMVVRREGRRHGFAFVQPLRAAEIAALGPQASNVEPLFTAVAAPSRRSWQASLAMLAVAGGGAWSALALLLYLTA